MLSEIFVGHIPDLPTMLLIEVIVTIGVVLQASIGMGFGMFAAPLLALIDTQLVPGVMLVMGFASSSLAAFQERRNVAMDELKVGIIGRIAGAAIAVYALSVMPNRDVFSLVFGIMVLIAVGLAVSGWKLAFNKPNLILMTLLSGLMGTMTSVGAPPMALVYQHRDVRVARPTLNAIFSIGGFFGLCGLEIAGWFSWKDITTAFFLLPGFALGFFIARFTRRLAGPAFRILMLVMAFASAVILIWRGASVFI